MENFEVKVNITQTPELEIKGYAELEQQVVKLVQSMKEVEVTEENMQASKKLVAQVKHEYDKLDTRRKEIKRELLKPYEELDKQMKELKLILDEGDSSIRDQLRELEKQRREEVKLELEKTFDEYVDYYVLAELVTFEEIYNSQWTNKSMSLKRGKEAVIAKLASVAEGKNFIDKMIDDPDDRIDATTEWLGNGFNAMLAVRMFKERDDTKKKVIQHEESKEKEDEIIIQPTELKKHSQKDANTFIVYGLEESHSVVKFMLDNDIEFKQI